MPARPEGVSPDGRGAWYFKATTGRDPLTGRRVQVTKRGFRTAGEAARARSELVGRPKRGSGRAAPGMTVNELLDRYLDGLDADGRLSAKTRFDYRKNADVYVRPILGDRPAAAVTPEVVLAWQRSLAKAGGARTSKPLASNTIRLARAPLAGAFKLAVGSGIVSVNPLIGTPRPTPRRTIPQHWSPEQARTFLGFMEGDRQYPLWAFLLGAGLRIGELVALRWTNVDLERRHVRIVEFASTLGYEVVASAARAGTLCAPSTSTTAWSGYSQISGRDSPRSALGTPARTGTSSPSGLVAATTRSSCLGTSAGSLVSSGFPGSQPTGCATRAPR